ncbi:MAG: VanW family protein [Clostridia bacterium]|nr:VanW family protein [Clostridia bacterium]
MKKFVIKTFNILAALVIFASASFFFCGFSRALPKGVRVNGTDVGGLSFARAKNVLRERVVEDLKSKRLHICADERIYTFAYPEIDFLDGFTETLKNVRRGGEYSSPVHYFLNGADEIAQNVCADFDRAAVEPYAVFNCEGEPFTYYGGEDGIKCDKGKLLEDISASLNGNFEKVYVCANALKRQTTVKDVEERTKKLYSFTTYFDGDNVDRCANIRLAAQKINGTVLNAGEAFSFNGVVGARTEENGFKQAKIIQDGKFVLGFGGGVCQVSTTLYNAAILSGLEIEEYHPHSLQVSYVAPSRDAMVSGSHFDLKFKNNRKTPVYIRVSCTLSSVCCTVYGESDGWKYSFKSEVSETVPRPDAVIVKGGEDKILSYGRDGTVSEGYIVRTNGGGEECRLVRKDKYLAVADVIQQTEEENSAEQEETA